MKLWFVSGFGYGFLGLTEGGGRPKDPTVSLKISRPTGFFRDKHPRVLVFTSTVGALTRFIIHCAWHLADFEKYDIDIKAWQIWQTFDTFSIFMFLKSSITAHGARHNWSSARRTADDVRLDSNSFLSQQWHEIEGYFWAFPSFRQTYSPACCGVPRSAPRDPRRNMLI